MIADIHKMLADGTVITKLKDAQFELVVIHSVLEVLEELTNQNDYPCNVCFIN